MSRTWVYQTLSGDVALNALLPGGLHASTSLDRTPAEKPFLMYRSVANLPDLRGDDGDQTISETFLIFAHDAPGDYLQIDTIMARIKQLLGGVYDQANGIIRSIWLETSDDFRDEDMGTITKYCRIQVKSKAVPPTTGG